MVRRKTSWLTSAKTKSIGTLLAAFTTSVVSIYTTLKTPSTSSAVNSYDTLKKELEAQRADIQVLYKSSAEERAWLEEWRKSEASRQQSSIEDLLKSSPAAAGPSAKPSASIMFSIPADAANKSTKPVPVAPIYKDRPALPMGKSFF